MLDSLTPSPAVTPFQRITFFFSLVLILSVFGVFASLLFLLPLGEAGTAAKVPQWMIWIGHFHPLVLHLPIGAVTLAVLFETLAFFPGARQLRAAATLSLWVTAGTALVASICGYWLALDAGAVSKELTTHLRFTLAFTGVCALLVGLRHFNAVRPAGWARFLSIALLPVSMLLLTVGAHSGGNMTHGSTFLTASMPQPLKQKLGLTQPAKTGQSPASDAPVVPATKSVKSPELYATLVAAVLEAKCTSCHNDEKSKGGLKLHTFEAILAGGERQADDGETVVVPGKSGESWLIKRALLPEDDEETMPPDGKPRLTAEELALLRVWIDMGATKELTVLEAFAALKNPPAPVGGPSAPAAATAQ